jgi:superfamily I DNA and/or RNA helicase
MQEHIDKLLRCIMLEEEEQRKRYQLDQHYTLRQMKAEGLAMHPLIVTHKNFGYADYPEFEFRLAFPMENNLFRDGAAIECFAPEEEPVKAQLLYFDGKNGAVRLMAPDHPDWLEDKNTGIKLSPDTRTTSIMKDALQLLPSNKQVATLFSNVYNKNTIAYNKPLSSADISYYNKNLNSSQQRAVLQIMNNHNIAVVHGPPGTGKTTTLVEAIQQLIKKEEKILLAAPSNAAVDNIAAGLIAAGVNILRVGNLGKMDEKIYPHTLEGKMQDAGMQKEIKLLRKRAEEFRRMALKYKRSFGKAEREQRNLLFKEVKNIRAEIRKLQAYNEEKVMLQAKVILGTPIALYDAEINNQKFDTLLIDEAGQCLQPLAWCIMGLAEKVVLAGDHLQLPPTVLSFEASKLGFAESILEKCFGVVENNTLLNTQYRMREAIANFSSGYFYNGELITPPILQKEAMVCFVDTAGSGFEEKRGADGSSLQNDGELQIVQKLLEQNSWQPSEVNIISPYTGQVILAKTILGEKYRVHTIDSFQGQENNIIIISLVRSNEDGTIGFLADYRRMNVAITRAKQELYVIGDSATIGNDKFYAAFLAYVEQYGTYKTVWEMDVM